MKKIKIKECKFILTNFFNTKLAGIDFSTSNIEGIILSNNFKELKGIKANEIQAIELAKLLGIKIV